MHYKKHQYKIPGIEIAQVTGPLEVLKSEQVLVLADDENLHFSARDLGSKVSYRQLTARFHAVTSVCSYHVFFSRKPGDKRRESYFSSLGWIPHPMDIEIVHTYHGKKQKANSDNQILFWAGALVSRSKASVIVLASGDGELVTDLAKAISSFPKPRKLVTMSLAGATSQRLNAARNRLIHANIEIGLDCLHPAQ